MKHKNLEALSDGLVTFQAKIFACFTQNAHVIYFLVFVAICAYGFELFNFNLTIDEEVYSQSAQPVLEWITQGRWGMYLLNKFLLPYTVVPFVPLFLALVFQIGAILLMMNAWDAKLRTREQMMIGSVALTFPTLTYIYMFSTLSYGIGFGFLCLALSLFIYKEGMGLAKILAILPAAFAVAIYQGFIPVLIAVFLVYLIHKWISEGFVSNHELLAIMGIHLGAIAIYLGIHGLLHFFVTFPEAGYVSRFFGIQTLIRDFFLVLKKTYLTTRQVYSGSAAIFAIPVNSLPYLLGFSLIGLGTKIFGSKASRLNKIILILLSLALVLLPFSVGIVLRGILIMRFLIAVPIVTAGLVFLGWNSKNRLLDTAMLLLVVWAVFQFVFTNNHLFASSHLALQADRALATRLIERIETAQAEAGSTPVKYLEVVGVPDRKSTPLMPKLDTFGASFFEWGGGIPGRIIDFLQTLGYDSLEAAPAHLRVQMIEEADTMPAWPDKGSIRIVGNVVLLKFGPYSALQQQRICSAMQNETRQQYRSFCE